jgi:hypothetical protein
MVGVDEEQLERETRDGDCEQAHIPDGPSDLQGSIKSRQYNLKFEFDRNGP